MVKLKKGLFYTTSVWDHNGNFNHISFTCNFAMKTSKRQNWGSGNISFSGNLPLGGFGGPERTEFGGPMDQIRWSHGPKCCENSCYILSPQIHLASWMSLGMMVTHPEWMAHKLLSSSNPTR